MCCRLLQVVSVVAAPLLDTERMTVLILTVELYMALTNRNMDPYHTLASIAKLESTFESWKEVFVSYLEQQVRA